MENLGAVVQAETGIMTRDLPESRLKYSRKNIFGRMKKALAAGNSWSYICRPKK